MIDKGDYKLGRDPRPEIERRWWKDNQTRECLAGYGLVSFAKCANYKSNGGGGCEYCKTKTVKNRYINGEMRKCMYAKSRRERPETRKNSKARGGVVSNYGSRSRVPQMVKYAPKKGAL